jgi:hypothetical protein
MYSYKYATSSQARRYSLPFAASNRSSIQSNSLSFFLSLARVGQEGDQEQSSIALCFMGEFRLLTERRVTGGQMRKEKKLKG